jgi:hypothetical protein
MKHQDSMEDLTDILRAWPHTPGRINARIVTGGDGRRKLQIRIELGVLQMEVDGRPDGERPHGFASLLEYQRDRLQRYREHGGVPEAFVLSPDECRALREEAVQHYHRYVGLFALEEFAGVVRDAEHSLGILDLCRGYALQDQDRTMLEQFRGQIIMMRSRSEAELALRQGLPKQALAALDRGLGELRSAYDDAGRLDDYDRANETQLLRGMKDALVPKLPTSQRVELQERLRAAIDAENYELAAILRDELRLLGD